MRSSDDVTVVALGDGTRIVRRARRESAVRDDGVEGYSWGGLTSKSRETASWLLYLPFTVVNGAGWAAPDGNRGRVHSALSYLLALTVTASYVFWAGLILVDLIGWQWRQHLLQVGFVADHAWINGAIEYAMPVLSVVLLVAIVFGFGSFVHQRRPVVPGADAGRWKHDETFSPSFYLHRDSERNWRWVHFGLMFACVATIVGVAIERHHLQHLWLGEFVVGVGLLQAGVLVAIWLLAIGNRPIGAALATLGVVMANAAFAGTALLVVKFLAGFPAVHLPAESTFHLIGGPELGLTSAWLWSLLGGAVAAIAAAVHVYTKPLDDTDLAPPVDVNIKEDVHGLTNAARNDVLNARRLARLSHSAHVPLSWLSAAFLFGGAGYAINCVVSGHGPFDHAHAFHPGSWPQWVGGFVLLAIPAFAAQQLRKAATSESDRRAAGVAWDVMLIWPRRYHPLAVPPYAANATAELRERIETHCENESGFLVSAHSQGTALSFIALVTIGKSHPHGEAWLKKIRFVTYGSHLNGFYALIFPRHFNQRNFAHLEMGLDCWGNFWRRTDPIGGPVFLPEHGAYTGDLIPGDDGPPDVICPDPPVPQLPGYIEKVDEYAPLEDDRPLWLELNIHSYYLAEPALKRWVDYVKNSPGAP